MIEKFPNPHKNIIERFIMNKFETKIFFLKTSEYKKYIENPFGFLNNHKKDFIKDLKAIETPYCKVTVEFSNGLNTFYDKLSIESVVIEKDFNFLEVINSAAFEFWLKLSSNIIYNCHREFDDAPYKIVSREYGAKLITAKADYYLEYTKKALTYIESNIHDNVFFKNFFSDKHFEEFNSVLNRVNVSSGGDVNWHDDTAKQIHKGRNKIFKRAFEHNNNALNLKFRAF